MRENVVKIKSFEFAIRIVNLYKVLRSERNEFVMSKQALRSGTSVGANVREAINAQRSPDFIHKLSISQKECDETMYWLELLKETDFINEQEFISLHKDAEDLLKIIRSIIITSKQKIHHS
jgi:four helix bundle protein